MLKRALLAQNRTKEINIERRKRKTRNKQELSIPHTMLNQSSKKKIYEGKVKKRERDIKQEIELPTM